MKFVEIQPLMPSPLMLLFEQIQELRLRKLAGVDHVRLRRTSGRGFARCPRFEPLENRRMLTTMTVNSLVDTASSTPDGVLTLREAIHAANTDAAFGDAPAGSGVDVIEFSVDGVLTLQQGQIVVTEAIEISGPGASMLTIDAQEISRVFNITATTGESTISGLTLINGRTFINNGPPAFSNDTTHSGGAVRSLTTDVLNLEGTVFSDNGVMGANARAGAVFAIGQVNVDSSTFTNNFTSRDNGDGGAIFAHGGITATDSTFIGNETRAKGADGGALHGDRKTVTVTDSVLSGNSSFDDGGAIWTSGDVQIYSSTVSGNSTTGPDTLGGGAGTQSSMTIVDSTISGNHSVGFFLADVTWGGGGVHGRDLVIVNSTISGNSTGSDGGGVSATASLILRHSTVVNNHAEGKGGGLEVGDELVTIENSIIADNSAVNPEKDLVRPGVIFLNVRHSLIGDNAGNELREAQTPDFRGNLVGSAAGDGTISPLLGELANNGGDVLTHALLVGSPAINAGDPNFSSVLSHDQRLAPFSRVALGRIDMGAFEVQQSADFDLNGAVNGRDFLAMQRGFGIVQPALFADGDADSSEAVDSLDFQIWEDMFAQDAAVSAGSSGLVASQAAGLAAAASAPLEAQPGDEQLAQQEVLFVDPDRRAARSRDYRPAPRSSPTALASTGVETTSIHAMSDASHAKPLAPLDLAFSAWGDRA